MTLRSVGSIPPDEVSELLKAVALAIFYRFSKTILKY